jgi:hypothetical protein
VVAEIVGVISVSPRLSVRRVVEYNGLAAEATPTTPTVHHDLAYQYEVVWAGGEERCLERDSIGLFPETRNGAIRLSDVEHQPHRGAA